MHVDRSKSGEYASPKRIRITQHAWRACGVALSIFNDFGEHASRFTHHASRITRMWSRGLRLVVSVISAWSVAPVTETGFSHRFTAYKIVGHFFGLSYQKISGSNQVKIRIFRISDISVPCPHAQLRGRTVIKKLWTFFGPWGRARSQSPPCWIFRVKQIHPSTAPERTTRLPGVQIIRFCVISIISIIRFIFSYKPYRTENL